MEQPSTNVLTENSLVLLISGRDLHGDENHGCPFKGFRNKSRRFFALGTPLTGLQVETRLVLVCLCFWKGPNKTAVMKEGWCSSRASPKPRTHNDRHRFTSLYVGGTVNDIP